MDIALAASVSAMMQAGIQSNVQLAIFKDKMDIGQSNAQQLLKTMPSTDVNPAIGKNLNVVG